MSSSVNQVVVNCRNILEERTTDLFSILKASIDGS